MSTAVQTEAPGAGREAPATPSIAPLWKRMMRYRVRLVQGLVLLVVTNAFDKSIPWLLKGALDALLAGNVALVTDAWIRNLKPRDKASDFEGLFGQKAQAARRHPNVWQAGRRASHQNGSRGQSRGACRNWASSGHSS
jgi:hypothetical protein